MKCRVILACCLLLAGCGCGKKSDPAVDIPMPVISEDLSREDPIKGGMTLIQVRDILGEPEGQMKMGSILIWRYARGTVELERGIVTANTILSDYDFAGKQAKETQNKQIAEAGKQKKSKRKITIKMPKLLGGKPSDISPEEEKYIENATDSIMAMLVQSGKVSTNSITGTLSRVVVQKMVISELAKMPAKEREQLLSQFSNTADMMNHLTNSMQQLP